MDQVFLPLGFHRLLGPTWSPLVGDDGIEVEAHRQRPQRGEWVVAVDEPQQAGAVLWARQTLCGLRLPAAAL